MDPEKVGVPGTGRAPHLGEQVRGGNEHTGTPYERLCKVPLGGLSDTGTP